MLLNHVVIVVKLCCVEGLMEDRCISNEHSSFLLYYLFSNYLI